LVKRVDFRLLGHEASSSVYGFELTEMSALKFWASTGALQMSWSEWGSVEKRLVAQLLMLDSGRRLSGAPHPYL
jgi:hypothetical protein